MRGAALRGRPTPLPLLTLLLAAALPLPAAAQLPPGAPAPLTLDEAIERARLSNPGYRQEVNNLELNSIERRAFWLGFLPEPEISLLSTNMQWNRTAVSTDIFGDPIANPDFRMIQSASSRQSAGLRWQLNLQDVYRRRADRLTAENRVASVGDRGEALAFDVRLNFLDAQEMLDARALEEALLEVRRSHFALTEVRFGLALADRVDLLEAELDLVNQENELERSRAALATTLLQLRNRIGDPTLGEVEIVPTPLRLFDPAALDAGALIAATLESGPRVREARFTLREREGGIALDRAQWLPTLVVDARTSRQQFSRDSGDGFFRPLPDGDWSRTLSFTVAFPNLGTYFTRQNAGRQTDLNVRNAEEALRQARLAAEEEVRIRLVELGNQYRTLALQERRAELAAERLALQQEYYRIGEVDYDALQSSAEASASAERQVLQARYAFERALIQLEREVGAPLSPTPER